MSKRYSILILSLFIISVAAAQAGNDNTQTIGPVLKKMLSENQSISSRNREILLIVIDKYLPKCPANLFHFDRIEDALSVEGQGDGSFQISTHIACDKRKDTEQMKFTGEYIVVNSDGSLRARNDAYQPLSSLANLIAAAKARQSAQESEEPTDKEIRQKQIKYLLSMLEGEKTIGTPGREIYHSIISNYFPTCPDYSYEDKKSVQQVVWLHKLNTGYVAVLLAVCDWKDAQAFYLNANGRVVNEFQLPLGKYGFSPEPIFTVADVTGDSQQEFLYEKIFPTSSVPVFNRSLQIYKYNPGKKKLEKIFETETEMQDCFEASRDPSKNGERNVSEVRFEQGKGLIKIGKRKEEFNCDEFTWGEKPVRAIKTANRTTTNYQWNEKEFKFVETAAASK